MRMPRLRFRIWWLIAAVAAVALSTRHYLWLSPPESDTPTSYGRVSTPNSTWAATPSPIPRRSWIVLPVEIAILIAPLVGLVMAVRWGVKARKRSTYPGPCRKAGENGPAG